MSKNALSLHDEEMEKSILYPGLELEQSEKPNCLVLGRRSIISQNFVQIRQ